MTVPIGRIDEVVVGCADPGRLARFWAAVLVDEPGPFQVLLDPEGHGWCLVVPAG